MTDQEQIRASLRIFDALRGVFEAYKAAHQAKSGRDIIKDLRTAAAFIRDNAGFLHEEEELIDVAKSVELTAGALSAAEYTEDIIYGPV